MRIQFHVCVHRGDALFEPGLEGRNLVSHLVLISLFRFLVVQSLLQTPNALLDGFAVFSELFYLSTSLLHSLLVLVLVLLYLAQMFLVLRCVGYLVGETDRQHKLLQVNQNFKRLGGRAFDVVNWQFVGRLDFHRALNLLVFVFL